MPSRLLVPSTPKRGWASSARASGVQPKAVLDVPVLWLGLDRASIQAEARWVRQATSMDVQVAISIEQARAACQKQQPLACIVEFELAHGDNGVVALEALRTAGVVAPAVLLTYAPALALQALERSRLLEAVPVVSRSERYTGLREWLDEVRTCLAWDR